MKVVPLGKAVREHGVPRGGRTKFKVQLFNLGALLLKDRNEIFWAPEVAPGSAQLPAYESYKKVELAGPAKPLGATWDRTPAVILEFNDADLPPKNAFIGIPREAFPKLGNEELYLCDLIGKLVYSEKGEEIGPITAVFDIAPTMGGSFNLQCRGPLRSFEFPLNWIDWKLSEGERLVVPDVRDWM